MSRLLFGDDPKRADLIALAATTALVPALLWFRYGLEHLSDWSLIQHLLFILLAGGVVANAMVSTQRLYSGHSRLKELGFYSVHVLQCLLLWAAFDVSLSSAVATWGVMMMTALPVSWVRGRDRGAAISWALASVVIGTSLLLCMNWPPEWVWFSGVFLLKLTFCHASRFRL